MYILYTVFQFSLDSWICREKLVLQFYFYFEPFMGSGNVGALPAMDAT